MLKSLINRSSIIQKEHLYRESLHTLLYSYPEGLSAIDIAGKLNLSDSECEKLLYLEQIRDAIDADPYSGILIYTSKRVTKPNCSLSKAIAMARHNQSLTIFKVFSCFSFALISTTLISININLNKSFSGSEKIKQDSTTNIESTPIQARSDAKLTVQRRLQLESEKNYLDRRIMQMQSLATDKDCASIWQQDKVCNIEGQFLSKLKFEREIAEMKLKMIKINEVLAPYN